MGTCSLDSSDLDDEVGDVGFDPNNYEGVEELSPLPSATASLLPPHVKAACIAYQYEQQEQWCYTCDETGDFSHECPVCLQALKDKKGLNSKGALNVGGWKPLKQPERAMESAPPRKWDVWQHAYVLRTWCLCWIRTPGLIGWEGIMLDTPPLKGNKCWFSFFLGHGGKCQHDYPRMHGGPGSPDRASHRFMGRGYNYWPSLSIMKVADRVCFHEGANQQDIQLWWGSSCTCSPQFCWVCTPCPHHTGDTHHGSSDCDP